MKFKFEGLHVWERALAFAQSIYEYSRQFPREERYGVTAQIRNASLSIALNIAEGEGRHHTRDVIRFFRIARGSLNETVTLLIFCKRIGIVHETEYELFYKESQEIAKMLHGLIKSLER